MIDTYEQGYHKALIDVCDWFDQHSTSLSQSRAYTKKRIPIILKAMRDGHEILRTWSEYAEMTVDKDWKGAKLRKYGKL